MITAYDALFAKIFDENVDIILVGDSLNMSFNGQKDTLSATMDMMIYHTKAVSRETKNALVVCDMPFASCSDKSTALSNASRIYKETNAHAIKIEGGKEKEDIIKHLTTNSIAVMAHIGLMPQFVRAEGGYKVKGKDEVDTQRLIEDALAVEEAGAFAIVIEGVKPDAAKRITKTVSIPTIGIGSGVGTDGQVLVWSDMLGLNEEFKPKFVKEYINGAEIVKTAIKKYADEVRKKEFPSKKYAY